MIRTAICDKLGIEYPIIQGGMAWLGTWELASAVSEAGGLGFIGAGNAPPQWVEEQISMTRERTEKPFGVNIMLMSPFVEEVISLVIKEEVPIVALGGGNPGVYIPQLKQAGIKVMPVISSVALAKRAERLGVEVVVAEGMESGGHVGDTTTMALIPQVVDAIKLPVIAAGGIANGRGLVAALALGARGIQMGTRFVCSTECIAHPVFKEKLLQAHDRATVVAGESTGHPVRVLKNRMSREFLRLEKEGVSERELDKFGEGKLRLGVVEGDLENGSLMAGQVSGLMREIKLVREIIAEVIAEAKTIIAQLKNFQSEDSHE